MQYTFYDINEAYCEMQVLKHHFSEWEDTRNGRALAFTEPMMITHVVPERRVLFDPIRNANPFFHYMEAIWMLSGSDSVRFPAQFAKQITEYSDDGELLHGAYGHRWRSKFGVDQLAEIISMLKADPFTRRAVLGMWSPEFDLNQDTKDLPCNTHIYFRNIGGALDMTVCNRSNDLVWGCLGANAVHFSILQEYIANATGLRLGKYHQFTNNLHVYAGFEDAFSAVSSRWYGRNQTYQAIRFGPDTLNLNEAADFVIGDTQKDFESPILTNNAIPMLQAWRAYKDKNWVAARLAVKRIYDEDWREACTQWIERRYKGIKVQSLFTFAHQEATSALLLTVSLTTRLPSARPRRQRSCYLLVVVLLLRHSLLTLFASAPMPD